MSISSELIQEFVKITNDSSQPTNTEETVQGTVRESNGVKYVQLDGSDQLTPVTTTMEVSDGDRVTVLIKNHTATITGNITSPAAKQIVVQNVNDKVDVAYGRIGELTADTLTITERLNANSANIEKLEADVANIDSVSVTYLEANYTKTYDLKATYATIESLNAVNAKIDNLDVGDLTADFVKTSELAAKVAALGYATVDNLNAATARITTLESNQITVGSLKSDFADITLSNVTTQNIGTLFAKVGLIDSATIQNGKITGYLDSVSVNANSITAGTLSVDRLIFRGSTESIVYELNNITGALQAVQSDTLNGEILTDRSIDVDKIVAHSITANEIAAGTITANEIKAGTITASKINMTDLVANSAFINAISTNSIVVGASNNASAALSTANAANSAASSALAGANSSVKSITMHYLATNADSGVTTSTSGWTTTVQSITSSKKYLWTYQTITTVAGTSTDTTPVISGVYGNTGAQGAQGIQGEKGETGADGAAGAAGVGIAKIVPLYYLNSSATAPSAPKSAVTSTSTSSGVWTTAVPTYVTPYTYFTCTQTQYTNGTYGWSAVVTDNALTNANSTATSASSAASNALSTANGAAGAALQAQSTAESAIANANNVRGIAQSADTKATSLQDNIYVLGTTEINGGNIRTGTIDVNSINANSITSTSAFITSIFAQDITATGTIAGATLIVNSGKMDNGDAKLKVTDGTYTAEYFANAVRMVDSDSECEAYIDIDGGYAKFYIHDDDGHSCEIDSESLTFGGTDAPTDGYATYINASFIMTQYGRFSREVAAGGELRSINKIAFRSVYDKFGVMFFNNGGDAGFLLTNANDPYGNYNSIRPFLFSCSTGAVTMGTAVTMNSTLKVSGQITAASVTVGNNASLLGCMANGTQLSLIKVTSDDKIQVGYGYNATTELLIGDHSFSSRIRIHSKGRIDIGGYGQDANGNAVSLAGSGTAPEFRPTSNGVLLLGTSSYKWKAVYATTGSIQTSDKRYKSDICDLDPRYEALAQLLTAKSYIMNIIDDKRRVGYIAQEVEELALSVGLTMDECSFVNKDWVERKDYTGYEYSLEYSQIHTLQIASLQKQVNELQNRLAIAEAQLQHYQVQQLGS